MSLPCELYQEGYRDGFEAGVEYTFGHLDQSKFNPFELSRFADWMELKNPWKTYEEWYILIVKNYVNLTPERYEEIKRRYSVLKEKYKNNPGQVEYYVEAEKELDKDWEQIQKTGTYTLDIPRSAFDILCEELKENADE